MRKEKSGFHIPVDVTAVSVVGAGVVVSGAGLDVFGSGVVVVTGVCAAAVVVVKNFRKTVKSKISVLHILSFSLYILALIKEWK